MILTFDFARPCSRSGEAGCNFRLSQTWRKVARTSDLASPNEACNAIKGNLITLRHPHAPPPTFTTVGAPSLHCNKYPPNPVIKSRLILRLLCLPNGAMQGCPAAKEIKIAGRKEKSHTLVTQRCSCKIITRALRTPWEINHILTESSMIRDGHNQIVEL